MKLRFAIMIAAAGIGCSSAPPPSPGVEAPTTTTDCAETDKSVDGVCYPTTDIGTGSRTSLAPNGVPGQRIANFAFTGYPATDTNKVTAGPTQAIHLAQYFNPNLQAIPNVIHGVPVKLIHLTVAAVWCGPCNQETDFLSGANWTGSNPGGAAFAAELAPLGVVFLQAISDGPVIGTGATLTDLDNWINHHQNDFTSMLDPGVQNLGVFFDAASVPFNMNIDARSMEILTSEIGFDTNMDATIKNQILPWIDKNAAKP